MVICARAQIRLDTESDRTRSLLTLALPSCRKEVPPHLLSEIRGIPAIGLFDTDQAHSVVAVHGLNSSPNKCWAKNNVLWLRDFLPQAIPSARICTFGYNAAILEDASRARIRDHAQSLLQDLSDYRQSNSVSCLLGTFAWIPIICPDSETPHRLYLPFPRRHNCQAGKFQDLSAPLSTKE